MSVTIRHDFILKIGRRTKTKTKLLMLLGGEQYLCFIYLESFISWWSHTFGIVKGKCNTICHEVLNSATCTLLFLGWCLMRRVQLCYIWNLSCYSLLTYLFANRNGGHLRMIKGRAHFSQNVLFVTSQSAPCYDYFVQWQFCCIGAVAFQVTNCMAVKISRLHSEILVQKSFALATFLWRALFRLPSLTYSEFSLLVYCHQYLKLFNFVLGF